MDGQADDDSGRTAVEGEDQRVLGAGYAYMDKLLKAANDAVYLPEVALTAKRYGPLMALGLWQADQTAPLFLVSNLTDPDVAWAWYRQRFQIETFFSDQKSRGFHLHQSHIADLRRLSCLLIVKGSR